MVNVFIAFVTGFVFFIFFSIIMMIVLHRKSFRNRCEIARQTGSSNDDVIWIQDRFRVKNRSGFWVIEFLGLKEKTSSVEGRFWTKFIKKSQTNKILRYTEEQWKTRDLSRLIQRGIKFYETNEGEFHPMTIDFDGNRARLNVISQDSRQFLINEIKDVNSLTKNRFMEKVGLIAGIVAVLIMGVMFILGMIWMKESAQDSLSQSQQACIEYYKVVQNITGAVQQAGQSPGFIDDAINFVQPQGS